MRKLIAIALNDVKIEFSEPSTLIFFLALPLIFTFIIGAALSGGGGSSSDDPRLAFVVVNHDQGSFGGKLIQFLEESDTVRPVQRSEEEALEMVNQGANAALFIPGDFSSRLENGKEISLKLIVQPNNNIPIGVEQAIRTASQRMSVMFTIAELSVVEAQKLRPFGDASEQAAYYRASLEQSENAFSSPPVDIKTTRSIQVNPQIAEGFSQSSPGQLVTWVLITLLGGSEVFVSERLGGTLRRLLITPTRKSTILTGKIIGRFSMGMVQMMILILFGGLVLGVNWGRSPGALAIMLISFGLVGTSLGMMLGAFARTRKQAGGLTTLFSMLLASLGGAWWPLEVTPMAYQHAVKALPSTWAMIGLTDVIVRGQGVIQILPEAAILLGFSVLFFTIGIWNLRFE